ncbi:hypothetical protein MRX96_016680 [Rhipicephalus microplus]
MFEAETYRRPTLSITNPATAEANMNRVFGKNLLGAVVIAIVILIMAPTDAAAGASGVGGNDGIGGVDKYVDDYLIVLGKVPYERVQGVVKGVLEVFNRHSSGLKFTHEMLVDNEIQFLDLRLKFAKEHICFKYNPRSKKGLLPFDSAHSKLIKRGIVLSACAEALDKSCPHLISESFEDQVVLQEECGCDTGQQQFAKHKRKANQLAEFLWQNVRSTFTSKPRLAATGSSVTYLGDVRIPETVEQVLKKGPKYSFQPRSTRPEMLSHVHRFGQRVQEQDQQRAIGDGIDCLVKTSPEATAHRDSSSLGIDSNDSTSHGIHSNEGGADV